MVKSKIRSIFSTRLRQAFDNSPNWNQTSAAKHFSVTRNTVNTWVAGTSWPGTPEIIDELAEMLDVTVQWLMGSDKEVSERDQLLEEIVTASQSIEKLNNLKTVLMTAEAMIEVEQTSRVKKKKVHNE